MGRKERKIERKKKGKKGRKKDRKKESKEGRKKERKEERKKGRKEERKKESSFVTFIAKGDHGQSQTLLLWKSKGKQ